MDIVIVWEKEVRESLIDRYGPLFSLADSILKKVKVDDRFKDAFGSMYLSSTM